uniref:RPM1 interacting protein 13 n=1 Tax=Davidia involucrata TaxID=16924 RepID=A0A5B7CCH7_DAVIN
MDPKRVVLDISSDEEGWGETGGNGGGGDGDGDDIDYWISELLDDSDDVVCVGEVFLNHKQRLKSMSVVAKSSAKDEDDDCVVLDGDPDKPVAIENDTAGEADELLIVSEKGQIACRDYPHPRHLCAKFPFSSTPHERHCDMCHCYVCDSHAPCVHWGTGTSSIDHCHATDKEPWKFQRRRIKRGDKSPPSIPKLPDTSLSTGLPQMNQVLPVTLPNLLAQNQVSRPTTIRACSTSTNLGVPNVINQGRNERPGYVVPRNKFQPHLVSQQLPSTRNNNIRRDRRHSFVDSGPRCLSSNMFKRTGSVAVPLTTNRSGYGSSNNNYGSQYSRDSPPIATSNDKNPIVWQGLYSGMTLGSDAYQSSSQQDTGSIFANSVPSQPQVSSQPNMGSNFVNPVLPQPQISSQPNMGRVFVNSVPLQPQVSPLPNLGSIFANSVPSQPQGSSQLNVGSIFANSAPSQPQVYSQPISSQDGCQQGNQTQSALDPSISDFDPSWVTPTSQSNQQPLVENFQLQSAGPTYDPSLVTEYDPQFPGSTNPGPLDFEFDWMLENQSLPGSLEVSVAPGLNVLSPEHAHIDAGILFDL